MKEGSGLLLIALVCGLAPWTHAHAMPRAEDCGALSSSSSVKPPARRVDAVVVKLPFAVQGELVTFYGAAGMAKTSQGQYIRWKGGPEASSDKTIVDVQVTQDPGIANTWGFTEQFDRPNLEVVNLAEPVHGQTQLKLIAKPNRQGAELRLTDSRVNTSDLVIAEFESAPQLFSLIGDAHGVNQFVDVASLNRRCGRIRIERIVIPSS